MLTLTPITISAAKKLVRQWHRHLPELQGALFASAVSMDGEIVGVACAVNPARVWQGTGRVVIGRVAVQEGVRNGCSMLYGSMCRAAKALGYSEAWTYTLPSEPGTSLRAAGFTDMGLTDGGEWGRPGRPRQMALHPEPKRRWRRLLR